MALKKGPQDFVVIVSAKVDGHLHILAVLKNRKKATVKAFLQSIPATLAATIETNWQQLFVKNIFYIKQ